MVPSSGPPPGLPRPKTSPPPTTPPANSASTAPHLFSPAPTQPRASWFQLLAPSPPPGLSLPPAAAVSAASSLTHHRAINEASTHLPPGSFTGNNNFITDLSTSNSLGLSATDPWTRAHLRVCAHASASCSACSIALVCCSCRALRFTPGPPPVSPVIPAHRSRSASLALFRNVGNGTPPPGFDNCGEHPPYDDEAYTKALAECDTCNNSSCPRGPDEPATYTIIVEQFDDGLEEFYDRTFRACSACNCSCNTYCKTCGPNTLHTRAHILCLCPMYVSLAASLADWKKDKRNHLSWKTFFQDNPSAFTFGDLPDDVH